MRCDKLRHTHLTLVSAIYTQQVDNLQHSLETFFTYKIVRGKRKKSTKRTWKRYLLRRGVILILRTGGTRERGPEQQEKNQQEVRMFFS